MNPVLRLWTRLDIGRWPDPEAQASGPGLRPSPSAAAGGSRLVGPMPEYVLDAQRLFQIWR